MATDWRRSGVYQVGWCASFTDASRSTSCHAAYLSSASVLYRNPTEGYVMGAENAGSGSFFSV
jgi:hypothetical protein